MTRDEINSLAGEALRIAVSEAAGWRSHVSSDGYGEFDRSLAAGLYAHFPDLDREDIDDVIETAAEGWQRLSIKPPTQQ